MKKPLLFGAAGLAAVGIALIGGTCIATGNCQSKTASMSTAKLMPEKREIHWLTSLEAAKEESARTGKLIAADFYASWCPPCKMMDEKTYPDPKVIAESQKWVMLKIDTDKQQELTIKYRINSLPTMAVLNSDGSPVTGARGFLSPTQFIDFLSYAQKQLDAP